MGGVIALLGGLLVAALVLSALLAVAIGLTPTDTRPDTWPER